MRKLGAYIQNPNYPLLMANLRQIDPAVIVMHAESPTQVQIMRDAFPKAFIVGRIFMDQNTQGHFFQSSWSDAQAADGGTRLAEYISAQNSGAVKISRGGRPLLDAVMGLNEPFGGPRAAAGVPDIEWQRGAKSLDVVQAAFQRKMYQEYGLETVAFNIAAGNFGQPYLYTEYFPLTLSSCKYLGFHIYGWPSLIPDEKGWNTSALQMLPALDAIHKKVGHSRHFGIVTELGLTMAYGGKGKDVGWQNESQQIAVEDYDTQLRWFLGLINGRNDVLGAALYSFGPNWDWASFRHIGTGIVERMATYPEAPPNPTIIYQPTPPVPTPQPEPPMPTVDKNWKLVLKPPVRGYKITQHYGENPQDYKQFKLAGHDGLDWPTPLGTPVYAAAEGVVTKLVTAAGTPTGNPYGIHIRITHPDGSETFYCHLSAIKVTMNQVVNTETQIGNTGSTGNSTGPHFHLSLRLPGFNRLDAMQGFSDPERFMEPIGTADNKNFAAALETFRAALAAAKLAEDTHRARLVELSNAAETLSQFTL